MTRRDDITKAIKYSVRRAFEAWDENDYDDTTLRRLIALKNELNSIYATAHCLAMEEVYNNAVQVESAAGIPVRK